MALIVADRVQETTTTTGTGTYTLAGAKDGYQSFAAVGDGNTCYYAITDGTDWETGIGTFTLSGTTLARTTIIESSNSDAAVSWSAGSKDIFVTSPADKTLLVGRNLYADNPSSPTAPSATGANAVAIGNGATAGNSDAIAIGRDATTGGTDSIAIGRATTTGSRATALGYGADATGQWSLALGSYGFTGPVAAGTQSVAIAGAYASGTDSFAAAIANNTSSYGATSANSIAMGYQAKAPTNYAVAIGAETQSRNWYGISIGYQNDNGTADKALTLGWQNTTSGNRSVVIGDNNDCTVADAYALGTQAKSSVRGKYAYASGQFAAVGDAQGGQFILRADTTDATATVLTTNNNSNLAANQIVAASDTCITFDGTITAMQNGAQAYASWKIEGLLVNDGGTTTLANSATTVIQNLSSWGMALSADNTNNALAITVTGEAAHNIRWVANIRTTEVTYA